MFSLNVTRYALPSWIFIVAMSLLFSSNCHAVDRILWFDSPGTLFEECLPIGNGRIGASMLGGVKTDRIILNDITLWSGEPVDHKKFPRVHGYLPGVRKALFEGDYKLADRLVKKIQGKFTESFAPLGDLIVELDHSDKVSDYRRQLDISTAVASVSYTCDGVQYEREAFTSHPDKALFLRFTADKAKALSLSFSADSKLRSQLSVDDEMVVLSGRAPVHAEPNYRQHIKNPIIYEDDKGTRFRVVTKILSTDGTVQESSEKLTVSDASEVTVAVVIATSFDRFDRLPILDEKSIADEIVDNIGDKSWDELFASHKKDYQGLFNRVEMSLGKVSPEQSSKPTGVRVKEYTAGAEDTDLESLYFQYGRYLLISCSRTTGVPANLQGLWNPHMRPPWSCNYTANINVEMNYWPAEVCNLSELHQPLLGFIENVSTTGNITADHFFGCRGWTCCHNTDIWAVSNPVGDYGNGHPVWANWCLGGAWLSTHLWERYSFTKDNEFLADKAYPIMKGATQFCLDWLVEGDGGELVTAPSTSPENLYKTPSGYVGATAIMMACDLAMIRELFDCYLAAAEVLDTDPEFRERVAEAKKLLPAYNVGSKGQLLEWRNDWEDDYPEHRHVSHLFGVYPGHHITPESNPALIAAARRSLDLRGDGGTGWSKAWKVALWARIRDGNRAYKLLRSHLTYSDPAGELDYSKGGGTFPNLWNNHPPFQMDGNFGATAAIAEMLVQSTPDSITLLPALPDAWSEGKVKGLCARGGFVIDMEWLDGEVVNVTVTARQNGETTLQVGEENIEVSLRKGESQNFNLTLEARRPSESGKRTVQ